MRQECRCSLTLFIAFLAFWMLRNLRSCMWSLWCKVCLLYTLLVAFCFHFGVLLEFWYIAAILLLFQCILFLARMEQCYINLHTIVWVMVRPKMFLEYYERGYCNTIWYCTKVKNKDMFFFNTAKYDVLFCVWHDVYGNTWMEDGWFTVLQGMIFFRLNCSRKNHSYLWYDRLHPTLHCKHVFEQNTL